MPSLSFSKLVIVSSSFQLNYTTKCLTDHVEQGVLLSKDSFIGDDKHVNYCRSAWAVATTALKLLQCSTEWEQLLHCRSCRAVTDGKEICSANILNLSLKEVQALHLLARRNSTI